MFCTTRKVAVEEFTFSPGVFLGSYPFSPRFIGNVTLLNISMGHLTVISSWLSAVDLNPGNCVLDAIRIQV